MNTRVAAAPSLLNPELPVGQESRAAYPAFPDLFRPLAGLWHGIRRLGGQDRATRESKRLAEEIKQTLGINGFLLNLASSPALAAGLPACWDVVRPSLETPEFENATAQIESEAFHLAEELGDADYEAPLRLSRAEAAHLQVGLDFHRFFLPRLLVLSSVFRLACQQEMNRQGMVEKRVSERTAGCEDELHGLFRSIRRILGVTPGSGSVAMPLAWSRYLAAGSAQLRPLLQGENFHRASDRLRRISRLWAPSFQERISAVGLEGLETLAGQVAAIEIHLPSLLLSTTFLGLYYRPADRLTPSPVAPSNPRAVPRRTRAPQAHPALQPLVAQPLGLLCPAASINLP